MRRGEDLTGYWQAKERGCEKARAKLVEHHLRIVKITRKRLYPQIGSQLGEDLEAEGRLMLVRCVDDFDRSRRVAFTSYAIMRIRGAMGEYLRRDDWLTRGEREKVRRGETGEVELVSLQEWLEQYEERDLPDPGAPVEETVLKRLEAQLIRALVDYLPRRQRAVLIARYWQELTFQQYAARKDRCPSRAKQWESEALEQLRRFCRWTGVGSGF